MTVSTLYLCYFGLREPLVQTQVLPYLRLLTAGGIESHLLTFEPRMRELWSRKEIERQRAALAADGISWSAHAYHKRPSLPATAYDIAVGALAAARLVRRHDIDVLHGRSHVGAAIGAVAKRLTGRPLIFDIRGFLPEEYVDSGVWPRGGPLFRVTKRVERRLLDVSDGFVVLTDKARDILFPGYNPWDARARPVEVIPCCVDSARFRFANAVSRESVREQLGFRGRRVMIYVGTFGGCYLSNETADLLSVAHRQDPNTFSLILTQSPPELIAGPLRAFGVGEENFLVRSVAPSEIPLYMSAADVAISCVRHGDSKVSCSPTKLAEYLAAGLPVIYTSGIGDVDRLVEENRVGVILREMNCGAYAAALAKVDALRRDPHAADRARECAARNFDLETVGHERYARLYSRVLRAAGTRQLVADSPANGRVWI